MDEPTMTTDSYGNKKWCLNGQLHRTDGPAIEYLNGHKRWYLNGKLHRTDGPAIEYADGNKRWYLNGQLHRTDGPAIEWRSGDKSWYLNDQELTESEFNERMNKPTMTTYPNENKRWCLNGQLHRTDGPAIEYLNGHKRWYLNGKLHRTDGPAIEYADGNKFWYLNGESHRTDGPAIEWRSGDKSWYLNDQELTESEFNERMNKPTMTTYPNGNKEWHLNGQRHRTDGPAIECADGRKSWYLHDMKLLKADFDELTK